jgi:hypothetical protein
MWLLQNMAIVFSQNMANLQPKNKKTPENPF